MFSELHSVMSVLANMYVLLSQEKPLNRSMKPPSHIKRQRSIAWHNYKDLRQRNGRSSDTAGQALIFYHSINDQYRNYLIHHKIQEELFLIINFSEYSKFVQSYFHCKKVGRSSDGSLRLSNGLLTKDPKIMSRDIY